MKKLILTFFLSSCYMSYTPEEETILDSYTVIESDFGTAEADNPEQIGVVDIDTATVDNENSSKPEAKEHVEKQVLQEPILYDVVPKQGCINKDTEIYLVGMHIHWEAAIKIRYQTDIKSVTFEKDLVDECNRSLIDWYDLTMISFRTRPDLILNDEYGFISGEYKLIVVNPDGKESNEIGLSLQYCGNEVEEIEGCYGN